MSLEQFSWKFCLSIIIICISFICVVHYTLTHQRNRYQLIKVFSSPRIFIFTSDDRSIVNNQNEFYTLGALINFMYARRYNYTYRYFHINYNDTRKLLKNPPLPPYCFNQVLNQERSVHWARLQVFWHVLETYSSTHDYFVYLDSDTVINNHNVSLPTLIADLSWIGSSKCKGFNITSCHMAFSFDTWNRGDGVVLPNSGVFLFQSTFLSRLFIQLWWHLNMQESNFLGFYEQDNLWNLFENVPSPYAPQPSADELAIRKVWNTRIKDILHYQNLTKHIGILSMGTFGNTHQSQFFVHMTSGVGKHNRQPEFLKIWQRMQGTLNQTQLLIEVEKQCVVEFDTTNDRIPWNFSISA